MSVRIHTYKSWGMFLTLIGTLVEAAKHLQHYRTSPDECDSLPLAKPPHLFLYCISLELVVESLGSCSEICTPDQRRSQPVWLTAILGYRLYLPVAISMMDAGRVEETFPGSNKNANGSPPLPSNCWIPGRARFSIRSCRHVPTVSGVLRWDVTWYGYRVTSNHNNVVVCMTLSFMHTMIAHTALRRL